MEFDAYEVCSPLQGFLDVYRSTFYSSPQTRMVIESFGNTLFTLKDGLSTSRLKINRIYNSYTIHRTLHFNHAGN